MAGIDWEAVARAETHTLRLRIIEYAAADPERDFAAVDLANEWGFPVPNVAHHLRELHQGQFLERARDRRTGGSPARCFRASGKLLR